MWNLFKQLCSKEQLFIIFNFRPRFSYVHFIKIYEMMNNNNFAWTMVAWHRFFLSWNVFRDLRGVDSKLSQNLEITFGSSAKLFKKSWKNFILFRSSHWRCSVKKVVLLNFAKFIGKHLCQSLFFNKVAGIAGIAYNFIKKRLWRRCFLWILRSF